MAVYRKIVKRKTRREPDKVSGVFRKSPIWSWRAGMDVTTVTLSCGHKKEYRGCGDVAPKAKALCKECS